MRKQTMSAQQQLLQEQLDRHLNKSELPFTVPLCLPIIHSDRFVATTTAFDAATIPRKG